MNEDAVPAPRDDQLAGWYLLIHLRARCEPLLTVGRVTDMTATMSPTTTGSNPPPPGPPSGQPAPASPRRAGGIGEWIFRRAALRSARAARTKGSPLYDRALNQSRLLLEVARRVAEPVESLPAGARPAVLAGLYREAILWALTAEQVARGAARRPVKQQRRSRAATPRRHRRTSVRLWAALPPDRVAKLAGQGQADEATLGSSRATMLGGSPVESLDTTAEEAARVRVVAEALLWDSDAPTPSGGAPAGAALDAGGAWRWWSWSWRRSGVRALVRGQNLVKAGSSRPAPPTPNACRPISAATYFSTPSRKTTPGSISISAR